MEDHFTHRNSATRFEIQAIDDSKTESYAKVTGEVGEEFSEVMRVQQHGFSSNPPVGSHALGISQGGKRDVLFLVGGEMADRRPTDLAPGDSKLYNDDGCSVYCKGTDIIITAPGITITINAAGIKVEGGARLEHDGKDFGKDHIHGGVLAGPDTTDVPAN